MAGSTKTSLTNDLKREGPSRKEGQKEADGRPFRNNQSPTTGTSCENSNGVHDETNRRANPVILSTPILYQGINAATTRRSKLGVKTRKLSVIIGSETVDRVRTPFGINKSEHGGMNSPIILVNKPA